MPLKNDGNLEDLLDPQPEAPVQQESTPPPETPPQPQVGETQAQPAVSSLPASLASRAQAAGLPLDGINSTDSFAEAILDRYLQDKAYAEYGRSSLVAGNGVKGERYEPSSQPEGEHESIEQGFDEQGHFGNLWKVAELDEASKYAVQQGIVVMGEDGLFQAKPGYESLVLPILNNINQSHIAQKEQVSKLFEGNFYQNIDKGLWPALEHRFQKMLEERLSSQFQTYEQKQSENTFIDSFQKENAAWLYGQNGQLSPDGVRFQEAVWELREKGITDAPTLAKYAIKIAGINTNAGTPPTGQPPAGVGTPPAPPTNGKARDEHGRFLPAGTPAPVPPPDKSKQETFLDRVRRQATLSDNRGGGLNSGSEYQVANEGDLENMFTDAWRQAAVT